jgi:Astacin (Peptidase family M12A)
LDGTENQRRKVNNTIKTWEKCANITFKLVNSLSADVRITFEGRYPYTQEKTTGKNQIVCLYGTADDDYFPPTEEGIILHEFGHVLGLVHEHLSPDMKHKCRLRKAGTLR